MPNIFRIAFIGIDHPHGSGWRDSIAQLQDEMQIVAFVPAFKDSLTSLEEKFSSLPRFHSISELLSWGNFDGAIICLPNLETPEVVIKLANAGKAVLVEKPCAKNAADWQGAVQAIQSNQVAFQAGYMWRYDEAATRLKTMIAEARFGKLISIQMQWFTSDISRRGADHYLFDPLKSGGGFFNWLACHWLDLLLYVTNDLPVGVTARIGNFTQDNAKVDDGGSALIDLASGCLAQFSGGYWLPRWAGESSWSIFGSQRWVHWKPNYPGSGGLLEIHGPQPQFIPMEEKFFLPQDLAKGYGGTKTIRLLKDWIAMANGGPVCKNTPESVLKTLQLIDAAYTSSAQEKRIKLN